MFIGTIIVNCNILTKEYDSFYDALQGMEYLQKQYPNTDAVFCISKKDLTVNAAVEIVFSQV